MGDSKCFDGKLILLQALCCVKNKLLPWGIYGIPPGAILFMWYNSVYLVLPGCYYMLVTIPPSHMIHGWDSDVYIYLCLRGT